MDTTSSGWWHRHGWTVALLLSAFGIAFALRTIWTAPIIAQFGPLNVYGGGSDSYYHSRVMSFIATTHHNLVHDPMLRFPIGTNNPREPLFDWMNAILGTLFAPFFGGNAVVAGSWFLDLDGPLWAALEVFPIYLIGREVSGRRMGLVAALVFPFFSASIDSSVFGYANYLSYYTFVILVVVYCYLRTVKVVGTRRWVDNYRDVRGVFRGLRGFLGTERLAVKWSVFTGVALGALALSWQGYTYAVVVIVVALLVAMVVERIRRVDSFGLYVSAWLIGLVAFPMALPYYFVQQYVTKFFGPPLLIYFGALALLLVFLFLRDVPWVFSLPSLVAVVGGAVLALKVFVPTYFTLIVTGQGYFVKTLIYSTIAEAQPPSIDQLILGFGVFTFFLAFVGLALFLYSTARHKFRRYHIVILVYAIVSVYLPITATKFFLVASPAFALLSAEAIYRALDVGRYAEFRRTISSLSDRGSQFAAFRKAFRPRHVLVLAVVAIVLIPNVWIAIDAGVPGSSKGAVANQINATIPAWLKLNRSAPASSFLGAAGTGLDTPRTYDSAAYNWLALQDTAVPEPDRPAFVSWWDYGFQAIGQGLHPSVADNFQHGIDPAGQFLLAQNESLAIGVLATTLLQAEQEMSHQPNLPSSLNTILAADGVNVTELHTLLTDGAADYTNVVAHPEKYLPVNPSTITNDNAMYLAVSYFLAGSLPLSGVAKVYDDLQAYTGWSIRYAMTDSRLIPFSGTNTGIFYAPADLTGRVISTGGVPETFYNVTVTGSDGNTYPLGQVPQGVSPVNYSIGYAAPFYDTMLYHIYFGYNGTDAGTQAGIPGLSGGVRGYTPKPGWMLEHFQIVYRTAYVCPGVANATSGSACFYPTNLPDATATANRTHGTADTAAFSYFQGGETMLAYYPGEPLRGTVVLDNGAPVSGLRVTVDDAWGTPHMTTLTAADGTFSLVLPPGNDTLKFTTGTLDALNQTGTTLVRSLKFAVPNATGYSLNAPTLVQAFTVPSGSVQGLVYWNVANSSKYETVDPVIPNAKVVLTPQGNGRPLTTATDASGTYALTNVPPGIYAVQAVYLGRTYNGTAATIASGTPVNASIGLTAGTLRGSVTTSSGSPVAGASVALTDATGLVGSAVTDGTGAYSITGVASGSYFLRASNGSLRSPGVAVVVPSAGGVVIQNLTIATMGEATVLTTYLGGTAPNIPLVFTPVPTFAPGTTAISALRAASTATAAATTGPDGTATVALAPGSYSVYALGAEGTTLVAGIGSLTVVAGGLPVSAVLALTPAANVSGLVPQLGGSGSSTSYGAVLLFSASGGAATAWASSTGAYTLRVPAGTYSAFAVSGTTATNETTYVAFTGLNVSGSTVPHLNFSGAVAVHFTVGAVLPKGGFYPAAGANVTLSTGGTGPGLTLSAASNGSVGFVLPSLAPLLSGGYCVTVSAFGFNTTSDCGLTASALGNLTRLTVPLTPVPATLTVVGVPSGSPITVNLTAESPTAVNHTAAGGPQFQFLLPPGTYGVGASAVIGNGTTVYLPASILSTEIPFGATQSNLTLFLVPEITAKGTLTVGSGSTVANASISLVSPTATFQVNGTQFTSGFRVAPGNYTATASETTASGTLANVTRVAVSANGTILPALVLDRAGVVLQGTLRAPDGSTVAANTSVDLVGPGGVVVGTTAHRGVFTASLPPGGTYAVYANATLATSGPNGTYNESWSTSAGASCTVGSNATACTVSMVGTIDSVPIYGTLYFGNPPTPVPGTLRFVGPYPYSSATVVTAANGSYAANLLPGAYYVYANASGTPAATFGRLLALPSLSENFSLVLEPAWLDTIAVAAPSAGETLGPVNVGVQDPLGDRTAFASVQAGTSFSIPLPVGNYTVRGSASGSLNGIAGNASGSTASTIVSGNVLTSLTVSVPTQRAVSATLVGPTSATVSAGGYVTFLFSVRASGNVPVTVAPVGSPAYWSFNFSWANSSLKTPSLNVTLTPGGPAASGEVTIHVPPATTVTHAPVVLAFHLANGTAAGSVSPTPTVNVRPYYGVRIGPIPSQPVEVGLTSVLVPFYVANTGNTAELVAASIVDGPRLASLGWSGVLLEGNTTVTAPVNLSAGANGTWDVNLTTTSSIFLPPGSITLSVSVTSSGGANTSTVTILIPKTTVSPSGAGGTVTGPGVVGSAGLPSWFVPVVAFVPAIALGVGVVVYRWWKTRRWIRR